MKLRLSQRVAILPIILFGMAHADVNSLFKKGINADVEIVSSKPLKSDGNLKMVVVKDKVENYRALVVTNKDESVAFGINSLAMTTNKEDQEMIEDELSLVMATNSTIKEQATTMKAIKKLPQDYIINLKGKDSKRTFYIISDPMCPHCQDELKRLEKRLEIGDVKFIPIGLLTDESAKKSQEIYDTLKNVKDDKKKIETIRKIYNENYKSSTKNVDTVRNISATLSGEGKVQSVPYIIEIDN